MTPRLTVELPSALRLRNPQTLASPPTVRWSSAVDSTIELACTGVAHKARAALSLASVGQRHPRHGAPGAAFAHPRAADAGSAPSDLFQPYVTQT